MNKLTKTQEKILNVMTDPLNWGKTQQEIADLSNCSRNSVYLAVKDDNFIKRYNAITMNILGSRTADIINASIKNALRPDGFQDRKMLLTMTGLYSDKMDLTSQEYIDNDLNITVDYGDPFEGLTTEELKELISKLED